MKKRKKEEVKEEAEERAKEVERQEPETKEEKKSEAEEVEAENNANKINFTKKLWYAVAKISKYDEMTQEGVKNAVSYFFGVIAILAVIFSMVGAYVQMGVVSDIANYINEQVPEFTLSKQNTEDDTDGENVEEDTGEETENEESTDTENYILDLEENEAIILDDSDFIESMGCVIVINTQLDKEEAINEYYRLADGTNACLVLLKDKCIQITSEYADNGETTENEEGLTEYTYAEILTGYGATGEDQYSKSDLINYLSSVSISYYIMLYFIDYFVVFTIVFAIDILVVWLIATIISKILKLSVKVKDIFSASIYSMTLASVIYVIYMIISYFANINIDYFNIIVTLIACIYIGLYFREKKANANKK